MARYPEWFERLDGILSELKGSPERLGRDEIRVLFGIGERDSLRLLNRFGARRSGDALAIDRGSLLHQLEALRSTGAYRAFRAQRGAVGRAVAAEAGQGREDSPSHPKRHRIHGTANFVPRPKLANLPPGVKLEPGRLTVEFAYSEDLWHALDQLANLAAADYEAFEQVAEPRP
jgi:hypothetical protein